MYINRMFISLSLAFIVSSSVNAGTAATISFNADMIASSLQSNFDDRDQLITSILKQKKNGMLVYPSEGYYYFEFMNGATPIKGNFRFDMKLRNQGKVAFTFYSDWKTATDQPSVDNYWILGAEDGLILTKISEFRYQLSYRGESAVVIIYDAESELSTEHDLDGDEEYVGPVFDESGIRFHLIFDHSNNSFLYVLNEDFNQAEHFIAVDDNQDILLGLRSKFAYFNDKKNQRLVLIGVDLSNVENNTYYDGPFDQLPDSFVDPVHLQKLIEKYEPRLLGKIGPYGDFLDAEESRYAIMPYMEYQFEEQLLKYLSCTKYQQREQLNYCLANNAESILEGNVLSATD
ncbi:MAG: hypothetical protein OFPII_34910 [Osedax symbiont Rs1]|nr:MAG: hypothetical protein OFPII_34910 [Osedax symbiont Rs1]